MANPTTTTAKRRVSIIYVEDWTREIWGFVESLRVSKNHDPPMLHPNKENAQVDTDPTS